MVPHINVESLTLYETVFKETCLEMSEIANVFKQTVRSEEYNLSFSYTLSPQQVILKVSPEIFQIKIISFDQ